MLTNWIPMDAFVEQYDLHPNTIYVMKYDGTLPAYSYKKADGTTYVNQTYFVRKKHFKMSVMQYSHDVYYYISEHFSDSEITDLIKLYDPEIKWDSYYNFLKDKLWRIHDGTIVNQKVNGTQWKFYKFCRFFMRKMRVYLTGVPVDLNYMLSRRMI